MKVDWTKLLSDKRPSKSDHSQLEKDNRHPSRSTFEADCDRIVFSKPFRRMGRKTQVHPRSINDHVHNRLTHSLEVASVGRTLGLMLGEHLKASNLLPSDRRVNDVASISQAACLAHDLGNPPFGHAGEHAIREWYKAIGTNILADSNASSEIKCDWSIFEGNAQSFRVSSRHDIGKTGYIRMSAASLGSMVKYPWFSGDPRAVSKGKLNFFNSEKTIVEAVWDELGLTEKTTYHRHPISFLTEASDDICYRIIDIEDAVWLEIINKDKAKDLYKDILISGQNPAQYSCEKPLEQLRGEAIRHLIDEFWLVFESNFEDISNCNFEGDLKSSLPKSISESLEHIDDEYTQIFSDREKIATELGAYKVLGKVCKALFEMSIDFEKGNRRYASVNLAKFLWGHKFLEDHKHQTDINWWLEHSRDTVASMTDNYAHNTANAIEGTRIYH